MFILASGSPRRAELLRQIGCVFDIVISDAKEETGDLLPPENLASRNAALKAGQVAKIKPGFAVLGADTVVCLDGRIYGKPKDGAAAKAMLRKLSDRTHRVVTGIAWAKGDQMLGKAIVTEVTFAPLTEETIERYVATGEPLDKAGGYAVQGKAAAFIKSINGSFSNVVGLPLYAVVESAGEFGVDLCDGK